MHELVFQLCLEPQDDLDPGTCMSRCVSVSYINGVLHNTNLPIAASEFVGDKITQPSPLDSPEL